MEDVFLALNEKYYSQLKKMKILETFFATENEACTTNDSSRKWFCFCVLLMSTKTELV